MVYRWKHFFSAQLVIVSSPIIITIIIILCFYCCFCRTQFFFSFYPLSAILVAVCRMVFEWQASYSHQL